MLVDDEPLLLVGHKATVADDITAGEETKQMSGGSMIKEASFQS